MATATLTHTDHWISDHAGHAHALFTAEGIHCAGCARSIQKGIASLPGIDNVSVNVVARRVSVDFRSDRTSFPQILQAVTDLGFRPVPIAGAGAAAAARAERKRALKRIGVAALGSMQMMMYAVGLYAGVFSGIDPGIEQMLKWSCLAITTPVLFYSGAPILAGAWREWRLGALGMDTSIALALVLAYLASVVNTVRGSGTVYFDAVSMFILFVLAARYLELAARHRSCAASEALASSLPQSAQRLRADGQVERIALEQILTGDLLRVAVGQAIPVDGIIREGATRIDEALLTGESAAQRRAIGDPVLGGSINLGAAILIESTRLPQDSTVNTIVRLLERASETRPRVSRVADLLARRFVLAVLLLTAIVGIGWALVEPSRAFEAMLATLAVTCPCALSLAMPAALAATMESLSTHGVLVTRADALESLSRIDTVALDKTGTLTVGSPQLTATQLYDGRCSAEQARALAAALERASAHPLAAAFAPFAQAEVQAADFTETAGRGLQARIDGELWRIGSLEYLREIAGSGSLPAPEPQPTAAAGGTSDEGTRVYLGSERGLHASFCIADTLRPGAERAVCELRELGLSVCLLSGDRAAVVDETAARLGITSHAAGLSPTGKLDRLRGLQQGGHRVLMIGDGINDGPVLAAADVSLAMGSGAAVAQAAADLVLLRPELSAVAEAVRAARRCAKIIRQNLAWALIYNGAAVPLAAFGFVSPWIAALGMSASSLLVVLNAQRSRASRR